MGADQLDQGTRREFDVHRRLQAENEALRAENARLAALASDRDDFLDEIGEVVQRYEDHVYRAVTLDETEGTVPASVAEKLATALEGLSRAWLDGDEENGPKKARGALVALRDYRAAHPADPVVAGLREKAESVAERNQRIIEAELSGRCGSLPPGHGKEGQR